MKYSCPEEFSISLKEILSVLRFITQFSRVVFLVGSFKYEFCIMLRIKHIE